MATTIPDIEVASDAWVDVNTASGITVGLAMSIQNKGGYAVRVYEGTTPPSTMSIDGVLLTTVYHPFGRADVVLGSEKIWARCASGGKSSFITVQAVV